MAIPTPPAAPNPLGTNFAAEALAFTQWMHTAAPEFNTAVTDANAAVGDAEQAVVDAAAQVTLATTQAGNASTSATTASGHATAADTARAAAVTAKTQSEDARDMSQTYAGLAGAAAGLPAFAGQALKNLRVKSDETGVEWTAEAAPGSMARAAKTGAYTLAVADKGALIDCSGTWTLGLTAAATLGAGWWCYVRNIGTGTITADPNASELIDGVTSGSIHPGMTLLIQCDGTAFRCVRVGPRVAVAVLTSGTSGTVPLGVCSIRGRVQAAGGYGISGTMSGAHSEAFFNVTPGASYTYAIGAAATTTGAGGDTTLTMGGRTITCKGGTSSQSTTVTATGGDINIGGSASNTWPEASPLGAGGSGGTGAAGYGGAGISVTSGAGVIVLEY